jgi:hypothetical protein
VWSFLNNQGKGAAALSEIVIAMTIGRYWKILLAGVFSDSNELRLASLHRSWMLGKIDHEEK